MENALTARGLTYVGGVRPNTLAWTPGMQPEAGTAAPKKGRRDDDAIVSLKQIARALPASAWRQIEWRQGTCDVLASRVARVRIHGAHRHATAGDRVAEWLLAEWPKDEKEPTKYGLSTRPEDIEFAKFVDSAKRR